MSRSNPNENTNPNPSVRWFEWNGEHGVVRYYDKEKKENVPVGTDFTFLLLDQTARVGGWDNESDSSIWSNEVKDSSQEVLVVKSRKGGTLAEGIYREIKDRVNNRGGYFEANCYIAFKDGGKLAIGSLRFKGAALHAWSEFKKKHRADIFEKAIRITGFTEGKKGKVTFRVPTLAIKDISNESNAAAVALDKELQKFFASYFKKPKREQAETPADDPYDGGAYNDDVDDAPDDSPLPDLVDDDIPFAWLMPLVLPTMGLLSAGLLA